MSEYVGAEQGCRAHWRAETAPSREQVDFSFAPSDAFGRGGTARPVADFGRRVLSVAWQGDFDSEVHQGTPKTTRWRQID